MRDKRGAIGAAMTWVVATFIILFMVILFVYSSYILAKEKGLVVSVFEDEKVSGADSEQILLALLSKKIGTRSVRNYIFQGEYEEIRSSVESLLNELPELKGEAEVYLGDKKIILKENVLGVMNE